MNLADVDNGLQGLEVAITGRLASMSSEEAQQRIADAGGRWVALPTEGTSILAVGQGGPPLGDDGRLTRSLREARRLIAEGVELRVVAEEEFLTHLGLHERRVDLHRLFTTAQLARILDAPASQIRAWVRHELIEPAKVVNRLCFFDFRQVATARALSRLTKDGVTPGRIRKSLEQLRAWLPETEASLAQLETLEQSELIVLRTSDGRLAEPTGQLRLEFVDEEEESATGARDAESWFERGITEEERGQISNAALAYERAAELGGPQPETSFNLGNALFALENMPLAAKNFHRAVEIDPDYVEAWNNLAIALIELDLQDDAVQAFRQALTLQPDYADAHFNLAETLADLGDYEGARTHWQAYLARDPASSWSAVVRERLRRTADDLGS